MIPGPVDVETPAVVIDRGVLQRNVARIAALAAARGVALRPHAKTHKLPEVAAMQLAAGAVGLTVATLGEAEVFAGHGVADLFVAYPLWLTAAKGARAAALAETVRLTIGTDSDAAVRQAAWVLGAGSGVAVMIEVDSGHHRSGADPADVLAIARAARDGGLRVAGVFTFPGHAYVPGAAATAAADEAAALAAAKAALEADGFTDLVTSGGSTPSVGFLAPGAVDETRPGVYVFGDGQQLTLGRCAPEDVALTVVATVVSVAAADRRVVLDAGSKVLGSDRPPWMDGFARVDGVPGAVVAALSEHHAAVPWPAGRPLPAVGSTVRVIPNHVCLVLGLVDEVVVVEDAAVVDRWRVAARGRNS